MRKGRPLKRAVEWFWGGAAVAALRASRPAPSARAQQLNRRARAATELARRALYPTHPFENGPIEALVCQLCTQAITWALLGAKQPIDEETQDASATPGRGGGLGALLESADHQLLARAAGSAQAAEALGREITGKSADDFAALPAARQVALAQNLLRFAEGLCDELDVDPPAIDRILVRRVTRLGALVVAIGLSVWGASRVTDRMEARRDLARGRPWTASSRYPEYGCISPAQECPNSDIYFFATSEENNPHIEWDLGAPKSVSGVRVNNRFENSDRAVPLIVETSVDHNTWTEVARRNDDFDSWKATFPAARARWVRLRVPRRTYLHLRGVRILGSGRS